RSVRNPAGIDLADGTFTDGLRLRTNAWVRVSYLWTASGSPTGTVRTTGWRPLTVRSAPNATAPAVGLAASRAQVGIVCAAQGSAVRGTASSTSTWYELAAGYYASAAYVQPAGDVPGC
ncbi:MAG: hypothetical protein ACRDRL_02470, partial [Sciscionella sp.]